jgi:hypothetical protein
MLKKEEFLLKCIKLLAEHEILSLFEIFADLSICANVSDVFFWGCADCEELTEINFHLLEESIEEIVKNCGENSYVALSDLSILFACKARKMRPQGAYYKYISKEIIDLIDKCGPERTVDSGNPCSREQGINSKGDIKIGLTKERMYLKMLKLQNFLQETMKELHEVYNVTNCSLLEKILQETMEKASKVIIVKDHDFHLERD